MFLHLVSWSEGNSRIIEFWKVWFSQNLGGSFETHSLLRWYCNQRPWKEENNYEQGSLERFSTMITFSLQSLIIIDMDVEFWQRYLNCLFNVYLVLPHLRSLDFNVLLFHVCLNLICSFTLFIFSLERLFSFSFFSHGRLTANCQGAPFAPDL